MKKPKVILSFLCAAMLIVIAGCDKDENVNPENRDVISAKEWQKIVTDLDESDALVINKEEQPGFKSGYSFSAYSYSQRCNGYYSYGTNVEYDTYVGAPSGYWFIIQFKVYSVTKSKYYNNFTYTTYGTRWYAGTEVYMIRPLFSWLPEDKEDIQVHVVMYLYPMSGGSLQYYGTYYTNTVNSNVRGEYMCD